MGTGPCRGWRCAGGHGGSAVRTPGAEFPKASRAVSVTVLLCTSPEPGQGYRIRRQLSAVRTKLPTSTPQELSFLSVPCRTHFPQHVLKWALDYVFLTAVLEELTPGMSEEGPWFPCFCWTCDYTTLSAGCRCHGRRSRTGGRTGDNPHKEHSLGVFIAYKNARRVSK